MNDEVMARKRAIYEAERAERREQYRTMKGAKWKFSPEEGRAMQERARLRAIGDVFAEIGRFYAGGRFAVYADGTPIYPEVFQKGGDW